MISYFMGEYEFTERIILIGRKHNANINLFLLINLFQLLEQNERIVGIVLPEYPSPPNKIFPQFGHLICPIWALQFVALPVEQRRRRIRHLSNHPLLQFAIPQFGLPTR
jgi:hypothetical protein